MTYNKVVIRRLLAAKVQVQFSFYKCGPYGGQNGSGQLLIEARRFPLKIIHVIPPALPTHCFVKGW